jgi:hypothetical protein
MDRPHATAERLREVFNYDAETGIVTRLVCTAPNHTAGEVVGYLSDDGYLRAMIDRRQYLVHRLIWCWVTGAWPVNEIDHKHGVKHDNRWSELRPATHARNLQNLRRARADNKCGLQGVSVRPNGKAASSIVVDGKRTDLGTFDTPEQAHAAYLEAKVRLHPFQTLVESDRAL